MDRFTEKDKFGSKLVLRNRAGHSEEHLPYWCVSTDWSGSITVRGAAVDRLAEYEDFLEERSIGDIHGAAAEGLPEGVQRQQEKPVSNAGNSALGCFSTYQLKAELRRRRKEGSWFRWLLWRMGLWI